jgi:hypothetical protein
MGAVVQRSLKFENPVPGKTRIPERQKAFRAFYGEQGNVPIPRHFGNNTLVPGMFNPFKAGCKNQGKNKVHGKAGVKPAGIPYSNKIQRRSQRRDYQNNGAQEAV